MNYWNIIHKDLFWIKLSKFWRGQKARERVWFWIIHACLKLSGSPHLNWSGLFFFFFFLSIVSVSRLDIAVISMICLGLQGFWEMQRKLETLEILKGCLPLLVHLKCLKYSDLNSQNSRSWLAWPFVLCKPESLCCLPEGCIHTVEAKVYCIGMTLM